VRYRSRMDEDAELTDFEAGFLLGYFAAKGIAGDPTVEQFSEAAEALKEAKTRMESGDLP
jgi:hypothetical protein